MNWQISATLIFLSHAIITLSLGILFIGCVLSHGPLCFSTVLPLSILSLHKSQHPAAKACVRSHLLRRLHWCLRGRPRKPTGSTLHQFGFLSLTRRQSAISPSLSRRDVVAASWFWRVRWFNGRRVNHIAAWRSKLSGNTLSSWY